MYQFYLQKYRVSHPSCHPKKKSQTWGEERTQSPRTPPHAWDSVFLGVARRMGHPLYTSDRCIPITNMASKLVLTNLASQTGLHGPAFLVLGFLNIGLPNIGFPNTGLLSTRLTFAAFPP